MTKHKYDYRHQLRNARHRGIEFLFTFDEWVSWWDRNLGADWFNKRGKLGHQYVMARHNDKGPYAPWNVKCITVRENAFDKHANTPNTGSNNGRAVLTEAQVKRIFASKETARALAHRYGVHKKTIDKIRRGERWSTVTLCV